jgi:uncharacterized C2H2 Zn-finger protein
MIMNRYIDSLPVHGTELFHVCSPTKGFLQHAETRKENVMAEEKENLSTAESLRATRTYGKFRCHNPTCMERLEPKKGDQTIKCPTCGMEFRVAWVKDGLPRIRGPVWDVNRKIAEEELARKMKEKGGK